jgi:hypothetical protein
VPVSGRLGWTDVSVSRAQVSDPRAQDIFDKLGLATMTMSFALAYDWDIAQRHASVHDTLLKVNELGTVTLSADLTNVMPNAAALSLAQLTHASLRFDDASLVDRVLRAGAAQSGTDPAVYRQQIEDMVRQQSETPGSASPAMTAACQAAADFIASPHSITIELAPAQPVPILALKGMTLPPGMLATMLGLTVSVKE